VTTTYLETIQVIAFWQALADMVTGQATPAPAQSSGQQAIARYNQAVDRKTATGMARSDAIAAVQLEQPALTQAYQVAREAAVPRPAPVQLSANPREQYETAIENTMTLRQLSRSDAIALVMREKPDVVARYSAWRAATGRN
jgi:hypothetical protein